MHDVAASGDLVDLHDARCRTECAARQLGDVTGYGAGDSSGGAGALHVEQGVAAERRRPHGDGDRVALRVVAAGRLIHRDDAVGAGKRVIADARNIQILGVRRECQYGKRGQQPTSASGDICNNDIFDKHATQFINFFVIVKLYGLKLGLY